MGEFHSKICVKGRRGLGKILLKDGVVPSIKGGYTLKCLGSLPVLINGHRSIQVLLKEQPDIERPSPPPIELVVVGISLINFYYSIFCLMLPKLYHQPGSICIPKLSLFRQGPGVF